MSDAMFRSVEHALRFAFEMQHKGILSRSTTIVNTKAGMWRGLTSHDLHAQAALIRAAIDRFPYIERAYLISYFGFDFDRDEAAKAIVDWTIREVPIGTEDREPYQWMVDQHQGRARIGGINQVRRMLRCRKRDALERRKAVWDGLDGLHDRAVGMAYSTFVGLGLVLPAEAA